MDVRIQALIDRAEIADLLNQYAHACDRGDEARLVDTYHPDSWDDHGPYKCSGSDFAKVVVDGNKSRTTMSHLLGQSSIKLDGDLAGAETYFIVSIVENIDGVRFLDQMGGRYIDELERRDGRWRIKQRLCTCEWSVMSKIENDAREGAGFFQGTMDRSDPSYRILGLKE